LFRIDLQRSFTAGNLLDANDDIHGETFQRAAGGEQEPIFLLETSGLLLLTLNVQICVIFRLNHGQTIEFGNRNYRRGELHSSRKFLINRSWANKGRNKGDTGQFAGLITFVTLHQQGSVGAAKAE
jgi:hypothetical protein